MQHPNRSSISIPTTNKNTIYELNSIWLYFIIEITAFHSFPYKVPVENSGKINSVEYKLDQCSDLLEDTVLVAMDINCNFLYYYVVLFITVNFNRFHSTEC